MLAYQIVFQITSNLQEKYQALDLCLEPLNEGVRKLIMYEEETCTNQRPLEGSPKAEGVADVNTDHSLWILSTQTAVGHVFLSIVLSILLCPLQKFTVPCADKTVACPASNNYLKGSFPSSTPYSQTLTRQECTPTHTLLTHSLLLIYFTQIWGNLPFSTLLALRISLSRPLPSGTKPKKAPSLMSV